MKIFRPWTWFKEWNSLTGTQQTSVAILVIGSAISIATYASYGSDKAYYTVVATTTVALLFDRITRYTFENKTVAEMVKINLSEMDLRYIGDSVIGLGWLTKNYLDLYTVDNTVYRPKGEYHSGYIEEHYAGYFDAIKRAIDNGCGWRDYALTPHVDAIHEFYSTLTDQQKRRYTAFEIKQDMPMFQLTIFRYKDQLSRDENMQVSFGWGFGGNHSRVYMSSDLRTVQFFEDYFHMLRGNKNVEMIYGPNLPAPQRPLQGGAAGDLPTASGPIG
jgi:hypothetical protein